MSAPKEKTNWSTAVAVGLPVGFAVFLLVVITATLVTFILPESYVGKARIRIDAPSASASQSGPAQPDTQAGGPPTEVVVLTSQSVLQTVVSNLDLSDEWGRRYFGGEKLPISSAVELLRKRLDVRPLSKTSIVEISAFDENPKEAAELANAVVAAYTGYNASVHSPLKVQLLDSAVPAVRPARPNKPLNILLGVVIGMIAGAGTGCFSGILFAKWWRRKS